MAKKRTLRQLIQFIFDATEIKDSEVFGSGGHLAVRTSKDSFVMAYGSTETVAGIVGGTNTYFLTAILAAHQFKMITASERDMLYQWWVTEERKSVVASKLRRLQDDAAALGYTLKKK